MSQYFYSPTRRWLLQPQAVEGVRDLQECDKRIDSIGFSPQYKRVGRKEEARKHESAVK